MENKYKNYSTQIQNWMMKLENTLHNEMTEIPDSFDVQLSLLADAFDLYIKSKKEIDKHGLLVKDSRGGLVKNPAISPLNSSALLIEKMLTQFGLTRMAKSKLKNIDEDSSSPIDEFI